MRLFFNRSALGRCAGAKIFDVPSCKALVTAALMPGAHILIANPSASFIYITRGLAEKEGSLLRLSSDPAEYRLLQSDPALASNLPSPEVAAAKLGQLRKSLEVFRDQSKMQLALFRILSCASTSGNIAFLNTPQGAAPQNRVAVVTAAHFLGVNDSALTIFFCRPRSDPAETIYARNGLITLIYEQISGWLVRFINKKLTPGCPMESCAAIEIVDAPGFQTISPLLTASNNSSLTTPVTNSNNSSITHSTRQNSVISTIHLRNATKRRSNTIESQLRKGTRCPFVQVPFTRSSDGTVSSLAPPPQFRIRHSVDEVSYDFQEFATRNRGFASIKFRTRAPFLKQLYSPWFGDDEWKRRVTSRCR